jgi:hypothetical protein
MLKVASHGWEFVVVASEFGVPFFVRKLTVVVKGR